MKQHVSSPLCPRLNFLTPLPPSSPRCGGTGGWGLSSVHNSSSLSLCPPHAFPLPQRGHSPWAAVLQDERVLHGPQLSSGNTSLLQYGLLCGLSVVDTCSTMVSSLGPSLLRCLLPSSSSDLGAHRAISLTFFPHTSLFLWHSPFFKQFSPGCRQGNVGLRGPALSSAGCPGLSSRILPCRPRLQPVPRPWFWSCDRHLPPLHMDPEKAFINKLLICVATKGYEIS